MSLFSQRLRKVIACNSKALIKVKFMSPASMGARIQMQKNHPQPVAPDGPAKQSFFAIAL
jgi:hypothetical protein